MTDIRANTVLAAKRRPVTLHTADELSLEGELAVPVLADPTATAVCLHPLPTHGGSLDSHLLRKMAWRLPALADMAVLRFNTRGTGASQGSYDAGGAERLDVAAALDLVEAESLPAPWLVGWSFGSELALMYGAADPSVVGAVLLAPPLKRAGDEDLQQWAQSGKPLVAIVPEFDDYLRPDAAAARFSVVPQSVVVPVLRSKHLFVGFAEEVLDEIVRFITPDHFPLPTSWTPKEPT
ncbi:MAG TPA: alpha/beta fold hydrolase [Mycobacteriales bacterium]|nr:alpha/beta fold hydrolase [Mycobacteriales bacterium]